MNLMTLENISKSYSEKSYKISQFVLMKVRKQVLSELMVQVTPL